MPIPTRSQSVSKRVDTGIPTRQLSVRQQDPSTVKSAKTSNLAIPKLRSGTKQTAEARPESLHNPSSRSQPKPAISHARSISTNHAAISDTKTPSTKLATRVATEIRKPGTPLQAKPTVLSNSSARIHTRSASVAVASKPTLSGSRLSTPKTDAVTHLRTTTLRKHPNESVGQISTAADVPASASSHLRDELLQLQLVYAKSSQNVSKYHHSIRRAIDEETISILDEQARVLQHELQNNEAKNSLVLRRWLDGIGDQTEEQKVQNISMILAEVEQYINRPDVLAPLTHFDSWFSDALLVIENRNSIAHAELQFVSPLGSGWQGQMLHLQERLSHCQAALHMSGIHAEESGIGIAVARSNQLINTLLLETETALSLEKSVAQAESEWKKGELRQALAELAAKTDFDIRRGAWAR